jgi:hypothetical protein
MPMALAQGSAFVYQGRLNDGANPANGGYDLRFSLHTSDSGGSQVGPIVTNSATAVNDGLFTVTLDFGANVFASARFLEIAARTNGGANFTTLAPRQRLAPAPFAILAENVGAGGLTAGAYGNAVTFNNAANNFSGSFSGNGAGVSNVNAMMLGGLIGAAFWQLGGNSVASGQFLGTTNNQPLEFRVNGLGALRLEPNTNGAPNVIAGSRDNVVDAGVVGAILGGGATYFGGSPRTNRIASNFGILVGGLDNLIYTNALAAFIGGGQRNVILGGSEAVIVGGNRNFLSNSVHSFIGAGLVNEIEKSSTSFVGSGFGNSIISQSDGTISGGAINQLGGTILDGSVTGVISNTFNTVGGGSANWIADGAMGSTIAGGRENRIAGGILAGTIPGGRDNAVAGDYAFAAGRRSKANHDGAFVWADSLNADFPSTGSNQFLIRASGGVGIGTNVPGSALHVNGTVRVSNGDVLLSAGSQFLADNGSNSAPGISFAGDSNTGLVHPLANTITFVTTGVERVRLESSGNLGVGTNNPSERLHIVGNILATGTITPNSDRNAKTDIKPVDTTAILEQVSKMPVQQWRFKTETDDVKHIGPMAQDFRSAFGLGAHATAIATVDADGVALAAIQGLNQKLEQQIKEKDAKILSLESRLAKLESLLPATVGKTKFQPSND